MMNDELAHVIKGLVQQEIREIRPFVYAHISNYNPALHAVRVVVPSMRDELTNAPLVSGWLPLGTLQTGSGTGVQVAPVGGASTSNPTGGEQCLVALSDRGIGVASVIALFFNNKTPAPSPALSSPLQAGEMVAFSNGVLVRWHNGGTLEITTTKDVNISVGGSANVQVTGTATVQSQGTMNLGSVQSDTTIQAQGTLSVLAGHVNMGVVGGSKVGRDGDPVYSGPNLIGTVRATTTLAFAG